jgi:hypothetical protein
MVTDITHIRLRTEFVYLPVLLDPFLATGDWLLEVRFPGGSPAQGVAGSPARADRCITLTAASIMPRETMRIC